MFIIRRSFKNKRMSNDIVEYHELSKLDVTPMEKIKQQLSSFYSLQTKRDADNTQRRSKRFEEKESHTKAVYL